MRFPGKKEQKREGSGENPAPSVGIGGVSIEEFMDQFNEDLAPDETLASSLMNAERVEIVTDLDGAGLPLQPEDEVRQQLILDRKGAVVFRSVRYFKGKGHYGIGRYETVRIAPSAVREIFNLLDTWLFVCHPQPWTPENEAGSWLIRAVHEENHVEMERGALRGAYVDGMDVSEFIRQRVPVEGLLLFGPIQRKAD